MNGMYEPQNSNEGKQMFDDFTAVLLLGHGSRAAEANEGMYQVAAELREKWPGRFVTCAFLEINEPSIPQGIDLCVLEGARRVILLPYFLHFGNHVRRDLPVFMEEGRARHPDVEMLLAPPLGFHTKLVEIVQERVVESIA